MKKKNLFVLVLMLMFLVSCSGGKKQVEKDFNELMSTVQTGDLDKMPEIKDAFEGMDVEMKNVLLSGFKKITYKINNIDEKEDTITLNVTIKSPDLSGLQEEAIKKLKSMNLESFKGKSQSELEKISQDITTNTIKEKLAEGKYQEKAVNVVYKKINGKWEIDDNASAEYYNIMEFGMASK